MDFKALKDLVKQGEGKQLEFKLKSNHPDRIVREIVAFANSTGGKLLIGIADDRSIQGLKYADEDEYILVRAIEKYCSPIPDYHVSRVGIGDEREVLVFDVPPSTNLPHYIILDTPKTTISSSSKRPITSIKSEEPQRKAYIRVADKAIQASKEMREILRRKSDNRNVQFRYGDKEKLLMQYLEKNASITVDDFTEVAAISRKLASRTLVLLVLANVLRILPDEVCDKFVLL